jgi:hypothetical protein
MQEKEVVTDLFGIRLEETALRHLKTAATWAIISAVCGFIVMLVTLISLIASLKYIFLLGISGYVVGILIGILAYLVISFLINFFLLKFGLNTNKAVATTDTEKISAGWLGMRNYLRTLGVVLAVIIFIIVVLAFLVAAR